jgi:hypothetical protein
MPGPGCWRMAQTWGAFCIGVSQLCTLPASPPRSLAVLAQGKPVAALQTVKIGGDIIVQVGAHPQSFDAFSPQRLPPCGSSAMRRCRANRRASAHVHHDRCCPPSSPSPAPCNAPPLQATPIKNGQPAGVIISLPYMRIRVAQRAPYKPHHVRPQLPPPPASCLALLTPAAHRSRLACIHLGT